MASIRIYIDMDGVIFDYDKRYAEARELRPEITYPQSIYGFYTDMEPLPEAVETVNKLREKFDVWILSKPSYRNPLCYIEKRISIEKHFGLAFCNKLILCPDKSLLIGDYLIDDMPWPEFTGKQIRFGSQEFPNWKKVYDFLTIND